MKRLFSTLLFPVVAVLACIMVVKAFDLYVKRHGQENGVTVIIPKGSHMQEIAGILAENHIVRAPWVFKAMVIRFGQRGRLKAGEYAFPTGASAYDDMMQMAKGEVVIHKITVPEGWTTSKIYALVQAQTQLTGDINPLYKEGDLLPETYQFVYGDTRDEVLSRMHTAMEAEIAKLNSSLSLEERQRLITLASIIERETRKPDERPRVAAVYLNRLKIGMKLQADPTVIYALTHGQNDLGRQLMLADLNVDSPYNTYRYAGLPPGPICNPGKAAIEAAAHPFTTDEIYFVADGSGGHRFAKTEKEHQANVNAYRRVEYRK